MNLAIFLINILGVILGILSILLVLRYNIHMLQLNGYKHKEHIKWLGKNIGRQGIAFYLALIGGVLAIIFNDIYTIIIVCLFEIINIIKYNSLRVGYVKKKLVYTARVKRIIATDIILSIIILIVGFLLLGKTRLSALFLFVTGLQLIMPWVANIINIPIEKQISQGFINDAKRLLRENNKLIIIGVTGSYGKTSVKFYLKELLKEKYNVLVTPESYNTPMGVVRTIREYMKPTDEIFVCEMGARNVGDIKELCDIVKPLHGVITSIGPQHLETFHSIENIQNTKFELADSLPKHGMIFLNGDNQYIQERANKYNNKVFYYSSPHNDSFSASNISLSSKGTSFDVTNDKGESVSFQTRLVGEHNVINLVGAIAVANKLGIDINDLKLAVRRIQAVPHRMELIPKGNVTIIDDAYNSNPVGSKMAVETLGLFKGLRIVITPGMVELGHKEAEFNYKLGQYASQNCDYILLVGKKHTEPIAKGALESGFEESKLKVFNTVQEAIAYAYSITTDQHKFILLENDLPDNY